MANIELTQYGRETFYERSLDIERPFRRKDIVYKPIEDAPARLWLAETVERGELHKVDRGYEVTYEWIND